MIFRVAVLCTICYVPNDVGVALDNVVKVWWT